MKKVPVNSVQHPSGAMKGEPLWPDFKGTTVEDAARYFSDKFIMGDGASSFVANRTLEADGPQEGLLHWSAYFKTVAPRYEGTGRWP